MGSLEILILELENEVCNHKKRHLLLFYVNKANHEQDVANYSKLVLPRMNHIHP